MLKTIENMADLDSTKESRLCSLVGGHTEDLEILEITVTDIQAYDLYRTQRGEIGVSEGVSGAVTIVINRTENSYYPKIVYHKEFPHSPIIEHVPLSRWLAIFLHAKSQAREDYYG